MTLLAELKPGATARVISISGTDAVATRLLEMGLTPGVQVRLCGTALLGDPLELELRGYHLTIRKSEAQRIEIEAI